MRFYDPKKGRISIGGEDIKNIEMSVLRSNISIVLQDSMLFTDTIENNIAYGFRPDRKKVIEAARLANAEEFISSLSEGYSFTASNCSFCKLVD